MNIMNLNRTQTTFADTHESVSWRINYENSQIRFLVPQRNLVARPFRNIQGTFKAYTGLMQTRSAGFTDAAIDFSVIINSITQAMQEETSTSHQPTFSMWSNFP